MANLTSVPGDQSIVSEFEKWQKSFDEEVYAHFATGNKERGNVAFDAWEKRFLEFLKKRFPWKIQEYKTNMSQNSSTGLGGSTILENFKRMKGNAAVAFLEQCIYDSKQGYLKNTNINSTDPFQNSSLLINKEDVPKIFISHSNNDHELAGLLVDLFRSALNLSAEDIRCTSVEGFKFPGGTKIDEQIKTEVLNAKVLIGLISKESSNSAYVLFELGARWGTGKNLIPLLAPSTELSILHGPITAYHALNCGNSNDLFQLASDVALYLGKKLENPNVYQKNIDKILSLSEKNEDKKKKDIHESSEKQFSTFDYSDANEIIKEHCIKEWPDDYKMQKYCIEKQIEALEEIKKDPPPEIPTDVFQSIREKSKTKWPNDFVMQHHAEKEQIEAYLKLNNQP